MHPIINVLFILVSNSVILVGAFIYGLDFYSLSFLFCIEAFIASVFTTLKLWQAGGNKIMVKYFNIDEECYRKRKISEDWEFTPFSFYFFVLIIVNICIIPILIIFGNGIKPQFHSFVVYSSLVILFDYIFFYLTALKKIDEKSFVDFLFVPFRSVIVVIFGVCLGGVFGRIFGPVYFLYYGMAVCKLFLDFGLAIGIPYEFKKSIIPVHTRNFR